MIFKLALLIPIIVVTGAKGQSRIGETKLLNLKRFSIVVPVQWKYLKERGEDSFAGNIQIDSVNSLSFDLGRYCNDLEDYENDNLYRPIIVDKRKAKLVFPKKTGYGTTGVYVGMVWKTECCTIGFQIHGNNLPKRNQEQLINAIKTLKFYRPIKIAGVDSIKLE
jgi:hypothetical protein